MATSYKDFIKANPNYIGRANVQRQPQQPQPAPKQRGKGGFLSSIISELGGAGGALGGAATGAALGSVVPGIGNIVGGIAGGIVGGFGGGTAGRLAENKIRDNEYRAGDALKEGLVSGAFGGIGPAWQGARGLSALGKASGGKGLTAGIQALSGFGDDATKAVAGKALVRGGKKAAQSLLYGGDKLNVLQVAGRGMAGNASGVGIGSKASGLQNLGAQSQDEILAALKKVGLSRANPEKTIRGLEPIINTKGANIAKAYANSTRKFTTQELNVLNDDILQTIIDDPSIELSKNSANQLLRKLGLLTKSDSPEAMWNFQKNMGKAINFGKNAEAKLVDREAIARVIRSKTGEILDDAVKEVRGDRALYHTLKDADNLMRVASKQADKSGLVARIGTSAPFRAGESKLGGALESIGNVAANRAVSQGTRLGRGMITRGIASGGGQPQDQTQMDQSQGQDMQGQDIYGGQDMGGMSGMSGSQGYETSQTQQSAYSLEQAMMDLNSTNNPKFQQQIQDRYEFVQKAEAAQQKAMGGGLNVTKPTSEKYTQAVAGLNSVQKLEKMITSRPGLLAATRTPGRGVQTLGIGSTIKRTTGLGEFDTTAFDAVDNLLRIKTGAQAPESEIRRYMNQFIPQAGDSKETVRNKLETMRYTFGSIMNLAGGQSSGSASDYLEQGG